MAIWTRAWICIRSIAKSSYHFVKLPICAAPSSWLRWNYFVLSQIWNYYTTLLLLHLAELCWSSWVAWQLVFFSVKRQLVGGLSWLTKKHSQIYFWVSYGAVLLWTLLISSMEQLTSKLASSLANHNDHRLGCWLLVRLWLYHVFLERFLTSWSLIMCLRMSFLLS